MGKNKIQCEEIALSDLPIYNYRICMQCGRKRLTYSNSICPECCQKMAEERTRTLRDWQRHLGMGIEFERAVSPDEE